MTIFATMSLVRSVVKARPSMCESRKATVLAVRILKNAYIGSHNSYTRYHSPRTQLQSFRWGFCTAINISDKFYVICFDAWFSFRIFFSCVFFFGCENLHSSAFESFRCQTAHTARLLLSWMCYHVGVIWSPRHTDYICHIRSLAWVSSLPSIVASVSNRSVQR